MTSEATTPNAGGATSADPVERIQSLLDAQDGDGQQGEPQGEPEQNKASSTDDSDEGVPKDGSEPQFTTDHLAQYLGIDPEQVDVDAEGQPVFKLKVDGEERTAKFSDFLADHQKRGAADKRLQQATERERAAERREQEAEQQIAQRHRAIEQQMQTAGQLASVAQAELAHDYNQINWVQLAQTDPGQAMALKEHFQQRANRIQAVMQNIGMRQQQAMQEAEAARKANEAKTVQAQQTRLLQLIPEWKDPAVFQKERADLVSWMGANGIDDADLSKASVIYALREAMKGKTLQASKPEIENKLRTAPKLVKPGTAPKPQEGKNAKLNDLKRQARGAGRDANKAAVEWLKAKGIA